MTTRLHQIVAESAARAGGAPAVTFKDATVGYGELWDRARRLGAGLRALGLRPGERVAIYLDKRIETVTALLGSSVAGAVFVPVNPLLRAPQVGHILRDCDVRVLVASAERLELLRDELRACPTVEHVIVVGGAAAAPDDRPQVRAWDDVAATSLADVAAPAASHAADDADVAAILYTSGSTGTPKGVVLSHRNLVVGAASVAGYLGNDADDTILAVLPLSFDAGLSQLTTAFTVGAHVVLVNYLLPGEVVRLCAKHRVTGLTCVPPLWLQLADQPWPDAATASLRYFANTGGRMPRATLDRLRATFPTATPYLMYGLTEAFRSTYLDPAEIDRRPDSIGKAIPNAEILVVGDDGSACGPDEEGELVHRGPLVALGYWDDPQRTAERFRPPPEWAADRRPGELAVWSGDTVVADADGFLYFVGRRDEMIKTSGYRVSPSEVEEVVYATGQVRDAVALGVEDERVGQRIVLVVSPPADAEVDRGALLAELKRKLPPFMVPRDVVVRGELPRSPNGKFDRNALRAQLEPLGAAA